MEVYQKKNFNHLWGLIAKPVNKPNWGLLDMIVVSHLVNQSTLWGNLLRILFRKIPHKQAKHMEGQHVAAGSNN
jgi:hypothetical protein